MDAAQALADLKQISTQVEHAVIFERGGEVVASTLEGERGVETAKAAQGLLDASDGAVQIEAALEDGSVVVVREGDRAVAATTGPEPTIGLVFYDLRTCLRSLAEEEQDPKPRRRTAARKLGGDAA